MYVLELCSALRKGMRLVPGFFLGACEEEELAGGCRNRKGRKKPSSLGTKDREHRESTRALCSLVAAGLRRKDQHRRPAGGSGAAQKARFRLTDCSSRSPVGIGSGSYRIVGFAASDSPSGRCCDHGQCDPFSRRQRAAP